MEVRKLKFDKEFIYSSHDQYIRGGYTHFAQVKVKLCDAFFDDTNNKILFFLHPG